MKKAPRLEVVELLGVDDVSPELREGVATAATIPERSTHESVSRYISDTRNSSLCRLAAANDWRMSCLRSKWPRGFGGVYVLIAAVRQIREALNGRGDILNSMTKITPFDDDLSPDLRQIPVDRAMRQHLSVVVAVSCA